MGFSPNIFNVGGDWTVGGAARADDILIVISAAHDLGRSFSGGGVGVNRVRVGFDDLSGPGVDQSSISVEDRNGDLVPAGRALAFLPGHGFGRFQPAGAIAAVESVSFT